MRKNSYRIFSVCLVDLNLSDQNSTFSSVCIVYARENERNATFDAVQP